MFLPFVSARFAVQRLVMLFSLLFVFDGGVWAQDVAIGVKTGLNLSFLYGSTAENNAPRPGADLAFAVNYRLTPRLWLGTELNYSFKNLPLSQFVTFDSIIIQFDTTVMQIFRSDEENRIRFVGFVETPVYAQYFFTDESHKFRPKVFGGFLLRYRQWVFGENIANITYYYPKNTPAETVIDKKINYYTRDFDLAPIVGAGFSYQFTPRTSLDVDLRVAPGAFKLLTNAAYDMRVFSAALTAGVMFRLGKQTPVKR